jgi:hypothetical protein
VCPINEGKVIRRFFLRLPMFFRSDRAESTSRGSQALQLLEDRFLAQGLSADEAQLRDGHLEA